MKFWRIWSATGDNLVYDGTPFCTWEYDEMSSLACDQTVFREGEHAPRQVCCITDNIR